MKHYRKTLGMIAWIADSGGSSAQFKALPDIEQARWNRIGKAVEITVLRRKEANNKCPCCANV